MKYDRRCYSRYYIEAVEAVMFIDGTEINCEIIEISEYGMKIKVDRAYEEKLRGNNDIKIQFLDRSGYGNRLEEHVITDKISVKHIDKAEENENFAYIGAFINSKQYRRYMLLKIICDIYSIKEA